ncbi:MAG: metallophosphoesterase [Acidobacteriota bacterium]|nr:metallophosphoesterase [Acidobacteriota bacterium]
MTAKQAFLGIAAFALGSVLVVGQVDRGEFIFAILGDRTGDAQPGVYEEAWREAAADHPGFVVTVGDTIEGGDDLTMDSEWQQVMHILLPYRRFRMFFAPGNHDVWSIASAQAFERQTRHTLHYSFDYKQAHFTVLDNSRSDNFPAEEMAYLEKDLQVHAGQRVKFIISHRPSWILQALLRNPDFPLQHLAERYGVKYIIAGHIHQMRHFELNGVTYLSMASSGGHLRSSKRYEDGWFFEHTLVTVRGDSADFSIKELTAPFGQGRISKPADWGAVGILRTAQH